MQLVIADTGPINYLVLIGRIDVLPALFQKVLLPATVRDELLEGPDLVGKWVAAPPSWIDVRTVIYIHDVSERNLDAGEEAAITLALELHADLLLMDDRDGVVAARRKGIEVIGTLGILSRAARHGLLNLSETFERLKLTNFRYRQETLDALLNEIEGTDNGNV